MPYLIHYLIVALLLLTGMPNFTCNGESYVYDGGAELTRVEGHDVPESLLIPRETLRLRAGA